MDLCQFMNQPMGERLRTCPQCKKEYKPDLGERKTDNCIQDEFPNATPIQREQLVTGICSDECWDNFLGVGCEEDDDCDCSCEGCGNPQESCLCEGLNNS